jgi:hypothetical protein
VEKVLKEKVLKESLKESLKEIWKDPLNLPY